MNTAQCEIKYLAAKSSCLVTSPHHNQIPLDGGYSRNRKRTPYRPPKSAFPIDMYLHWPYVMYCTTASELT